MCPYRDPDCLAGIRGNSVRPRKRAEGESGDGSYGERRTADEHAEGIAEVAEEIAHGGVPPSKWSSEPGPSAYATFYLGEIGDTIPIPRTAAIGMLSLYLSAGFGDVPGFTSRGDQGVIDQRRILRQLSDEESSSSLDPTEGMEWFTPNRL
jgi:hypothetical protein